MKLMVATNNMTFGHMMHGEFSPIVWASTDLETVAHYYEGHVVELDVALRLNEKHEYIRCLEDLDALGKTPETYGFGTMTVAYPPNAHWYSLSSRYIQQNIKGIREIFPDLSQWNEE